MNSFSRLHLLHSTRLAQENARKDRVVIAVGNSPHIVEVQPQILDVHIHFSELSFLEVQQLRVRNLQPYLVVGRESVLENVDDVSEGLHFLARHNDGIGKHLVGRASARTNLTPYSTMQRSTGGEREYRVK